MCEGAEPLVKLIAIVCILRWIVCPMFYRAGTSAQGRHSHTRSLSGLAAVRWTPDSSWIGQLLICRLAIPSPVAACHLSWEGRKPVWRRFARNPGVMDQQTSHGMLGHDSS
jgi:hypothetical protein